MVEKPVWIILMLAIFAAAGCSGAPQEDARQADTSQRTDVTENPGVAETTEEPPAETTAERSEDLERTRPAGARGAVPDYIVFDETTIEEGGVKVAQVFLSTRETSEEDLRLITKDLKESYRDYDVVEVEMMDGATGYGRAGSAIIMNTDEGARYAGYAGGIPNERGYVLETVD